MKENILILNGKIVNEGEITEADIYIKDGKIDKIERSILYSNPSDIVIDAKGKYIFPGIIDDQVHFREPGLTYKADIFSESRAAVAGGTTSFMEMPNTVPNALTQNLLDVKYSIASQNSLANYSFFMGASNNNIEEVLKTNAENVCGIKIFMGSSTGDMLVDNEQTLESIFSRCPMLIATHCEDEYIIKSNIEKYKLEYGDDISPAIHPIIRDEKACYKSSSMAIELAKKHNTRLHILHISTAGEINLFTNQIPLSQKKITAEVCVHHLWFSADDYEKLGNQIKCNPAIKDKHHKEKLFRALLDDHFDIIATDHAPHTWEEKQQNYWKAPSGLPLVQHSLLMMLEFYKKGQISLEKIAEKMCHAPAICFKIKDRGYVKEGYWADIAIVDLENKTEINKNSIKYKCNWSPLEGTVFNSNITHTIVSGHLAYDNGTFNDNYPGKRLLFNKN